MKTNDRSMTILICRNLHHAYFFEVGLTQILTYHKTFKPWTTTKVTIVNYIVFNTF